MGYVRWSQLQYFYEPRYLGVEDATFVLVCNRQSGGGTKTEIQIVYRDAVVEATRNNPAAGLQTAVHRLEKLLIRKGA